MQNESPRINMPLSFFSWCDVVGLEPKNGRNSQKLKFLHIPYSGGRSSAVLVAQMQLLTLCQPLAQHLQHSVISTMLVGYKLQLRFIGEVILASLGKILSKPREKQHQCVDFPSLGRFFLVKNDPNILLDHCILISFHFISFQKPCPSNQICDILVQNPSRSLTVETFDPEPNHPDNQ